MVERVLTRCADEPDVETAPLLTLLRRFAAEAAREEARLFCDELAGMKTASTGASRHEAKRRAPRAQACPLLDQQMQLAPKTGLLAQAAVGRSRD
jgi:hypothetical protein